MLKQLLKETGFRKLLESTLTPLVISDQKGRIIFYNSALERLFGYIGKELLELTIEDLIPERFRQQHKAYHADPTPFPHFRRNTNQIYEALELFGLRKEGSEFPVSLSLIPLETSTGLYNLTIVQDATRQKQARETLAQQDALVRESEARLRAILNTTVDGIIVIDENAIIETFNRGAERQFGYTAAEAIGQNISLLILPHQKYDYEHIETYLQAGQKEVTGISRETVGLHKDGSTFPVDISIAEMYFGERRLLTWITRDITERHYFREQALLFKELEDKNTELERFIYTVSHDLRSPLITIQGFSGALKHSAAQGNNERMEGDIQRIRAAADKMQLLLDDLLKLSRIGRLVNTPEKISLGSLAREAAELVEGVLIAQGVQVRIATHLPILFGDRKRLLEVMQNLIENAAKFMGNQKDPWVEIGALEKEEGIFCYVKDNGIGIDPRYHEKIFALFDRLDQNVAGTGIGLAIVKRIIEIHEGRVWVESEGPSQGSTFYFSIPGVSFKDER